MSSTFPKLSTIFGSLGFNTGGTPSNSKGRGKGDRIGFFHLPLELREEIYKYVLPHSTKSGTRITDDPKLHNLAHPPNRRTPNHVYPWRPGTIALLSVSRQVNAEASEIFWSTNIFNIVVDSAHPALVIRYPNKAVFGRDSVAQQKWYRQRHSEGRVSEPRAPQILYNTSKEMKELEEVPQRWLRRIRHVYLVVRRSSDFTFEPDLTTAWKDAVEDTFAGSIDSATRESIKRKYAKMLRVQRNDLLHRGMMTTFKSLNLLPPVTQRPEDWNGKALQRNKCAVRDIEMVIYPNRHLYKENIAETDDGFRSEAEFCFQSRLSKDAYRIITLKPHFNPNNHARARRGPITMGSPLMSTLTSFRVDTEETEGE
jgi:hypothetical protein